MESSEPGHGVVAPPLDEATLTPLSGVAAAQPTGESADGAQSSRADERRRRARRKRVTLIVPPIGAFFFAVGLLLVAAIRDGSTGDFLSPSHWARFDSGLYLEIAADGLVLTHCSGPAYPPHSACGTVGFAPLYPALIAAWDTSDSRCQWPAWCWPSSSPT